jgi:hypothetical protein
MVNRKRERIGLSLAPDVMDILNEHGRSEALAVCPACRRSVIPGIVSGGAKCLECNGTGLFTPTRPTRTEIIEQAILIWDELKKQGLFDLKEDIMSLIRHRWSTQPRKPERVISPPLTHSEIPVVLNSVKPLERPRPAFPKPNKSRK